MFFGEGAEAAEAGEVPKAGAAFIERVRAPPPNWKGMCSVTAVGIEDLVDEKMAKQSGVLLDWNKATAVSHARDEQASPAAMQNDELAGKAAASSALAASSSTADTSDGPQCVGIPMKDWVDSLRSVADLEDSSLLEKEEAAALKGRLRRLDVGTLLVVQAYGDYGRERLALELKSALLQDSVGTAS